ncbi:MAG: hypothetical protein KC777_22035, partial [Cyanobacteria bacterium HKST-UBA02]|nr:hypothetical protein [Cyanobacteria bacterium HKST-UBA02]
MDNDEIEGILDELILLWPQSPKNTLKAIHWVVHHPNPPKQSSVETDLGKMYGKSYSDVLSRSLDVLERMSESVPEDLFPILEGLLKSEDLNLRKKTEEAIASLGRISHHDLNRTHCRKQRIVLSAMEKWGPINRRRRLDTIIGFSKQALNPTLEMRVDHEDEITIRQVALPSTPNTRSVRKRVLRLLIRSYNLSHSPDEKYLVIDTLLSGLLFSRYTNKNTDEARMIEDSQRIILDFCISITPTAPNLVIDKIWKSLERERLQRWPEKEQQLKNHISMSSDFKVWQLLIGKEFPKDPQISWREADSRRQAEILRLVDAIQVSQVKDWNDRLKEIQECYSPDKAFEYRYLNIFLEMIGKNKPEVAIKWIKNRVITEDFALTFLLAGLWYGNRSEAEKVFDQWIQKECHFRALSGVLRFLDSPEQYLVELLFQKINSERQFILSDLIALSLRTGYEKRFRKDWFRKLLGRATELRNTDWVTFTGFLLQEKIPELSNKEWQAVLDNLCLVNHIDFEVDGIVAKIVEQNPSLVLKWFRQRIAISESLPVMDMSYDAIPFHMGDTLSALQSRQRDILSDILMWATGESACWQAHNLVSQIFPVITGVYERRLLEIVQKGRKSQAERTLGLLAMY